MAESLYTIEKIIDKMYSEKLASWVYYVKWEGFSENDNTWEPEENLVPLGRMLENFNKSWENKNKPAVPKAPKTAEGSSKKLSATKVKGLVDQGEVISSKKPLEAPLSKSPYLSLDAKDTSKSQNSSQKISQKNPTLEEKKSPVKKPKKSQMTPEESREETIKLISKKTLEKYSQDQQIDIQNNVFRNCKLVKPKFEDQVPWKILGARKRNNVIQYVVLFKAPPICMPIIITHDELAKRNPELICDYLFSNSC